MVSLLFFILAAACNSIMDTCQFHFENSVFNSIHCNKQFWNSTESWKNKYVNGDPKQGLKRKWGAVVPVQLSDSFHLFKFFMILCLALSVVTVDINEVQILANGWLNMLCLLVVYGTCWNLIFDLMFNRILKK
jgi:hypothetical protein